MRRTVLSALLCLLAPPVHAEEAGPLPADMAGIESAFAAGEFEAVRAGLAALAETGDLVASYRYGRALADGIGGPPDPTGAAEWLQRAVDGGHRDAATLLARLILSGVEGGPERDAARAAALLMSSAARGHAEAQYYLGLLTRAGDGVPASDPQAANWLLAAAEQGHAEAQFALSGLLAREDGPAHDPDRAIAWLREAASNGHGLAQVRLAMALSSGEGVARNEDEARRWYRAAAEAGVPFAQRVLGTELLFGDEGEGARAEGLALLERAAEAGEPGALYNLSQAYLTGRGGIEIDEARGAETMLRAAATGLPRAILDAGALLETGTGIAADPARAARLYRRAEGTPAWEAARLRLGRLAGAGALEGAVPAMEVLPWAVAAAEAGDAGALAWIETRAEEGLLEAATALAALRMDAAPEAALSLLRDSAQRGDPAAQVALGERHMTGDGVPLDYVAAHAWFNLAAALGRPEAAAMRDAAADLMTPEEVAAAQAVAREWFETGQPQPPETEQTVRTLP